MPEVEHLQQVGYQQPHLLGSFSIHIQPLATLLISTRWPT